MHYNQLKKLLEELYLSYKHKYSSKDPVWVLHGFQDKNDAEIFGLISAAFSYGSVDQINSFISKLLVKINNKPYEFTINFQKRKDIKYLMDLYYRFNTYNDLAALFDSLRKVLIKYSSLENLFLSYYNSSDKNIIPALIGFANEINRNVNKANAGFYNYLISNPVNGSTCKRMNLFLRWMVRKDEIDLGLWNKVTPAKLIMPVDVHVARMSKKLKLAKRKSIDLKFAVELTETLKKFDPLDPVRFDFALCHSGIDSNEIFKNRIAI
ncbi:MAG: TIGR02757 family protein [Chlorobi bacterium]|nr:TIGR02757 family protein [Chlorobiota bacterium]MCI0715611.1 TIGR02757 family protein [Chlorobiota bacterium]